jgi:hypothetical protein
MKNKVNILNRLNGLKEISLYKIDPTRKEWFLTSFSKEQLEINIQEIIRLIEEEKDESNSC